MENISVIPPPTSGTVVVERMREWFGLLRKLRVYIDNAHVGDVRAGECRSFRVTAGEHDVRVSMDWCRSPSVRVNVAMSATIRLRARLRYGIVGLLLCLFGIVFWPRRLFVLEEVAAKGNGCARVTG